MACDMMDCTRPRGVVSVRRPAPSLGWTPKHTDDFLSGISRCGGPGAPLRLMTPTVDERPAIMLGGVGLVYLYCSI